MREGVTREHRPATGPRKKGPEGRLVEVGRPAAADWLLRKLTCYAMRWTIADNTGQKWTGRDIGHADAEFWKMPRWLSSPRGPRTSSRGRPLPGRQPLEGAQRGFAYRQPSQETA